MFLINKFINFVRKFFNHTKALNDGVTVNEQKNEDFYCFMRIYNIAQNQSFVQ